MLARLTGSLRRFAAATPRRTDGAVAGVLAAVSVGQVLLFEIAPRPIGLAIALASTIPIAFRRDHPVAAALIGTAGWPYPTDGYLVVGYVAAFLLLYSLVMQVHDLRVVTAVLAWVLAISVVHMLTIGESFGDAPGEWIGTFFIVFAPVVVGRVVRRERDRAQRMAVVEERARIARELHDVVSHGVSVIAIQADAAEAALRHDPARAEAPLDTIRASARDALAEMRRMLGVLREDDEGTDHGPQPGLGRLPGLVEDARRAGVPVEVEVEGEPRPVAASVDLAAYRIVQEALTNVRRHANGARATVRVVWRPDTLELTVRDDGPGAGGSSAGGHGLVGMRERVRIHGGRLRTGPAAGRGFEIVAELPLEQP